MKPYYKPIILVMSLFVTACGGGGGGGESTGGSSGGTVVSEAIVRSSDIVAERDFDFDLGSEITLSIDNSSGETGALHLYSKAAHVSQDGTIYADPMSRITTIYPNETQTVAIEVNGNWSQLYAEWVPMNSSSLERYWTIELNQSSQSYSLSF
ncbi:hypothetical protein [Vibrio sp.]|uniref:hypothetical protein n=1 Tax=Vibrio sp. TaxID=678 RepID=UPI0031203CDA